MTPLDLRPKEEWEAILDGFARDVNMTACLMDEGGGLLMSRVDRYPLCASVRADTKATTFICSQTNAAMLAVVRKTLKPETGLCEAGLLRMVVPILKDGVMVGQVTACGLAAEDEEPSTLLVAEQLGITEERAAQLASTHPFGDENELVTHAERLFRDINSL